MAVGVSSEVSDIYSCYPLCVCGGEVAGVSKTFGLINSFDSQCPRRRRLVHPAGCLPPSVGSILESQHGPGHPLQGAQVRLGKARRARHGLAAGQLRPPHLRAGGRGHAFPMG